MPLGKRTRGWGARQVAISESRCLALRAGVKFLFSTLTVSPTINRELFSSEFPLSAARLPSVSPASEEGSRGGWSVSSVLAGPVLRTPRFPGATHRGLNVRVSLSL